MKAVEMEIKTLKHEAAMPTNTTGIISPYCLTASRARLKYSPDQAQGITRLGAPCTPIWRELKAAMTPEMDTREIEKLQCTNVLEHGPTPPHQLAVLPIQHPRVPPLLLLHVRHHVLLQRGRPTRPEQLVVPEGDVQRLESEQALRVSKVLLCRR